MFNWQGAVKVYMDALVSTEEVVLMIFTIQIFIQIKQRTKI